MTRDEIIDQIVTDIDGLVLGNTRHFVRDFYEAHMDWMPIELAPKTNFEPGLILLSNNQVPFFPCFWVEDKQCWVRKVSFMDANGEPKTVLNIVMNPTHFKILAPIP